MSELLNVNPILVKARQTQNRTSESRVKLPQVSSSSVWNMNFLIIDIGLLLLLYMYILQNPFGDPLLINFVSKSYFKDHKKEVVAEIVPYV